MTARRERLDAAAVAPLLLCCALWGANQVAAKFALAGIPPLTQAAMRSLGAALLVLIWSAWRRLPLLQRDGTLAGGLLAGALFAGEFACIFIGLQYTSASRMAVFVYLSPFVVALGMPFIARAERLSASQTSGLVLAFGAVAYAFAEGFTRPSVGVDQWIGDALGVLGAVLWGGTTLAIRATRLSNASAEKTLLYQLGSCAVLLGIGALIVGEPWPPRWTPLVVGSMLFQTVVVSFASYLVWFWLMRQYAATRLAAFTLLTPVFGLLAGAWLLQEPVTLRLVVALCGVTVGIALVNRPPRAVVA